MLVVSEIETIDIFGRKKKGLIWKPSYAKGSEGPCYKDPKPCSQTKIGKLKILEGLLYEATFKNPYEKPKTMTLKAVVAQKGELKLGFVDEKGVVKGAWNLRAFTKAELVTN